MTGRVYIENNKDLFETNELVQNSGDIKFTVTEVYLRRVSRDLRNFCKNI